MMLFAMICCFTLFAFFHAAIFTALFSLITHVYEEIQDIAVYAMIC